MNDFPILSDTLSTKQARELNPLVLAYIGDGAHTLYVRTKEVRNSTAKADKLHVRVTSQVKASAQAKHLEAIRPLFNEEEEGIFLRARNSHQHSTAKNASLADYKSATGFEAVLGFLYLTGQTERLTFLLNYVTDCV
ncbi:MAG: ribonuclease III [Clostridia bacterium]|nr:ribonuclease III [Clostridia bacterium]MDE7328881.1 ribonuclease III [Clostridia bacterium]